MWDRGPRDGSRGPGRSGPWAEGHGGRPLHVCYGPRRSVGPVGHPEEQGGEMLSRGENILAHRPPNLWSQTLRRPLERCSETRSALVFLSFPSFCGGTESQLAGQQA